eukprot:2867670-Prymnesium_polylepis.1
MEECTAKAFQRHESAIRDWPLQPRVDPVGAAWPACRWRRRGWQAVLRGTEARARERAERVQAAYARDST